METADIIPHLFRTEYRKIISVLCRRFGFDQIETAEDIASETFLTASQSWGINGVPGNPVAWLYSVAQNKAKNHLHRVQIFENNVAPSLGKSQSESFELDLSAQNINDSQLQMMFAICHPSIPPEAQIGLSLRILCAFGIDEIADAFLTNKETINKRLLRAKEKLRKERIAIELPHAASMEERIHTVLTTIYLLFNEGYRSLSKGQTIRKELCFEAMRLCTMLVENESTNSPAVNALMALMCFHTSRIDARLDASGELILYEDQDASLWNSDLISKGGYFLHCATTGTTISKYHLEAGIAYWATVKADTKEKWESLLQLYNRLLQLEYSPVAALNRTYVLSRTNGKEEAIKEAEKLDLTSYHFYHCLLGNLYSDIDKERAILHYRKGFEIARTASDKNAINKKIESLTRVLPSVYLILIFFIPSLP